MLVYFILFTFTNNVNFKKEIRRDSGSSTQHSGSNSYYCCQEPECRAMQGYPPPPSTFKRQKCLRYKRDRPILRSKSDISDRYWRPPEPPTVHFEHFFEHLGLTTDDYEDMLRNSNSSESPVFFSDVSTVDSSRPLDNQEFCPAVNFRSSEPPSIVERNARIIKWLCECRKYQLTWGILFWMYFTFLIVFDLEEKKTNLVIFFIFIICIHIQLSCFSFLKF